MRELTDRMKDSARRLADEPFFDHFLADARQTALDKLFSATTHEDLLRAQAWHHAVEEFETAVRKAART